MKVYDTISSLCYSHRIPAKDIPYLRPIWMKHHITVPDIILTYIITERPDGDTKYYLQGYMSFAPGTVFFPAAVQFTSGPMRDDCFERLEEMMQEDTHEIISPNGLGYMRLFLSQFLKAEYDIDDDLPDYWSYRTVRTEDDD